jgi:hypothetical protein
MRQHQFGRVRLPPAGLYSPLRDSPSRRVKFAGRLGLAVTIPHAYSARATNLIRSMINPQLWHSGQELFGEIPRRQFRFEILGDEVELFG